jgi:hypothetical protein
MRFFLFSLLSLASCPLFAQHDTTRILFIGNSYTYVQDVPALVKSFAEEAGFPLKYAMHAPGGCTVGDTSQGTAAHMNNPIVYNLIRSDKWDFVSLQDNQGRFVYGGGIFPDTNKTKVIRGHLKIRDSVKYYNSCARMLWFAGWAWKNGYPGIDPTGKGLIENIYENYQYLKDTAGEIISPIGVAWARAIDSLPAVDLWDADLAHQSLAGSYLTAAVIFTTAFRVNTEYVFFNGGLDSVTARKLRLIAYQTVMDSTASTNLSTDVPDLTATSSLLTASPGYSSYRWYQNGTLIGITTTNTFSITSTGCYQVRATASDSCSSLSPEKCLYPLSVPSLSSGHISMYPQPAYDHITIGLPYTTHIKPTIKITDITGKVLLESSIPDDGILSVSELADGMHFAAITIDGYTYAQKILIMHP